MDGSIKQQKKGGGVEWCGGLSTTVGLEDQRLMALSVPEKHNSTNTSASAQKQQANQAQHGHKYCQTHKPVLSNL